MRLILLKLLYNEARLFFNGKGDDIFKYYTGFFRLKNMKLESCFKPNKNEFFVLLYLSRRFQNESKGIPYFFDNCKKDYNSFDINHRLLTIKSKYIGLYAPAAEMQEMSLAISYKVLREYLSQMTDKHTYPSSHRNIKRVEGNVIEEVFDASKHNIRRLLRNDLQMSNIYFREICKDLKVVITDELQLFFEKFIYSYSQDKVFIPEYDFSLLIASYFIYKNIFDHSTLESLMMFKFKISKSRLNKRIFKFSKNLDGVSPEHFINKMNNRNSKRFTQLRRSIEFIDGYKRSLNYRK